MGMYDRSYGRMVLRSIASDCVFDGARLVYGSDVRKMDNWRGEQVVLSYSVMLQDYRQSLLFVQRFMR